MGLKDDLPRWIEGGGEICPFCGQPYIYEMERRCTHCDRPVCPWCCLEEDRDRLCPDCGPCDEGEKI